MIELIKLIMAISAAIFLLNFTTTIVFGIIRALINLFQND